MIYVCSDIHGQYKLYKRMLEEINFSFNDTLYILGDMIDRGPETDKLMLDIIDRANVYCCLGNHELMMYSHYIGDRENDFWQRESNGGIKTAEQLDKLSKEDKERVEDYIFYNTWLQMEIDINNKKFLLSHSSFVEDESSIKDWNKLYKRGDFYNNTPMDVTWRSPWRFSEYKNKQSYNDGRIHVIGHVPVQAVRYDEDYPKKTWELGHDLDIEEIEELCDKFEVWQNENIINIDGGCGYRSKKDPPFKNTGLICMNLTKFAEGEKDSFTYIR